ncbi:hypothetical protein [Methanobacterium formicicum]|uniref:hypothetical protein n=1 Tax=Methanobacterium formicicum TaxID=2162 RepID=UPI0024121788|nr:hypothetical protein [Methanobacterium formicicum]MDG3547998.1 hypothetical protein [Methanobacterium formicicum]
MITDSNFQSNIKSSIVPWALPREEIPVRIEIPRSVFFDKIRIKIPSDFKFNDFLNVAKVEVTKSTAVIHELIKTKSLETPLYFGFIVSSTSIPEKLKISKRIWVELLKKNEVVEQKKLNARIFRPKLEITDINEKIELKDNINDYEMPMDIKYIGFGDIQLKIEGKIEDKIKGEIISESETIVNELFKRIWEDSQTELTPSSYEKNREINIEDSVIQELIDKIEEKIKEDDIEGLADLLSEEEIELFKKSFSNPETKNKFLNVVYTRAEDIFIGLLSELFETNPTDNVKLTNSQTNIKVKINSHITSITTHLLYKDSIGNEYPPVKIPIKIVDNRDDRSQTNISMPIRINKWEEEPFMNVAEMDIEEDK